MSKGNLVKRIRSVDDDINGEVDTVPFLGYLLSEEKKQLMMHQWYLVESALDFQHWYLQTSRKIFQFMFVAEE